MYNNSWKARLKFTVTKSILGCTSWDIVSSLFDETILNLDFSLWKYPIGRISLFNYKKLTLSVLQLF